MDQDNNNQTPEQAIKQPIVDLQNRSVNAEVSNSLPQQPGGTKPNAVGNLSQNPTTSAQQTTMSTKEANSIVESDKKKIANNAKLMIGLGIPLIIIGILVALLGMLIGLLFVILGVVSIIKGVIDLKKATKIEKPPFNSNNVN